MRRNFFFLIVSLCLVVACGSDDDIDSDTEARWAYLGFDTAVDKAINLGFDGFNTATNANIDDQSGVGDVAGTIIVGGHVDQGASANKEMNLVVTMVDYNDGEFDDTGSDETHIELTYTTPDAQPLTLDISLKDIPDGTLTGSLLGTALIGGDLDAEATFNLSMSADIQQDPVTPDDVIRAPGTLSITGTVTSNDGVYEVDVLL